MRWIGGGLASAVALVLLVGSAAAAEAELRVPEGARASTALDGDVPRVEGRLLIHPDDDAGGAVRLGLLLDVAPGWHVYWRNPGDTGIATRVRFRLEGADVGPVAWPAPRVFGESEGLFTTYGYEDQVLLVSRAVPSGPRAQEGVVHADVELLACEVECIPGRLSLSRHLGVSDDDATRARVRDLFTRYAARVPRPPQSLGLRLEALYSQSGIRPGDRFDAAIAVHPCRQGLPHDCETLRPLAAGVAFVPDRLDGIELERPVVQPDPTRDGARLVTFAGRAEPGDPGSEQRLTGVLALRGAGGVVHVDVDLPLPRAPAGAEVVSLGDDWLATAPPAPATPALPLARALLLAFLGGLVLNLMPCVLPVLAIKVVAVADLAHRRRGEVLAHGFAYGAGIALTMSALAVVVILLRAAGTRVGWGFQFQEPLFVGAVSVLLVVFALNLFGVFEIRFQGGQLARLGQEASGARRSFFEGLLAVVLATPCTAPFLGTAVGFAFAGSGAGILAIFLAIGLGLAAPFVLVTLVPAWGRLVPRSGPWMLTLRAGLGFALLASAVWLLWIVGRSLGPDAATWLLALLLAVAFATWLYGLAQAGARPLSRRCAGLAVLLVACAGLGFMPREPAPVPEARAAEGAQPFEPAAVARALHEGRRVFVYFTADWCMTCKVNERRVIANADVRAALARMDVAVFIADWTRRDDAIRSELARFGRAGVPLYLVYLPSTPDRPRLLPELLTKDALFAALEARETDPGSAGEGQSGA